MLKIALLFLTIILLPIISVCQLLTPKVEKDDKFVTFYGLTALNSAGNDIASSLSATGRLAVEFVVATNQSFKINLAANLVNTNPSKGVKKDSIDFNSLMFPETGNFGFLFNPAYRLRSWVDNADKNLHSLFLEASFAYRKVRLDSFNADFKILSYNIGCKYQWDYLIKDDNHFLFTGMLYWNLFNVPDEDVNKFNLILNDPVFKEVNKNAEIQSVGFKVTTQYKNFIFFADLRKNIATDNLDDDNPFKGTKFNIGFATVLPIKRF
jgi:hypothetical protein